MVRPPLHLTQNKNTMATTRIKDISSTVTALASDDYVAVDGATNGTRKMVRSSIYTDVAAAFTGAPTTYDICPLNSGTNKIDATYLPTSGDTPKGEWNASTNSPALADGAGTAGDYYDVTTAGTQNLGSGNITFTVGDVVKYDGSVWYKIDSVANFLDGYSTAATSRTALEVNSVDEDAEATATKLVGPAMYFNGSSSYVEVSDDAKLSFTDGTDDLPMSISAWVKSDDLTGMWVITKYANSGSSEFIFSINNSDKLSLSLFDNANSTSCNRASDAALTAYEEQWIHIAATCSSSSAGTARADDITLYVNGAVVASTATNSGTYSSINNTSAAVWIGRQGTSYAKGHIKDVKLYNRSLTATEVAQLARGADLGYSDQYAGALGGLYTSDFTSDSTDGLVADSSNVPSVDATGTVGGDTDNVKFIAGGTTGTARLYKAGVGQYGKNHRIELEYYVPSGQTYVDGFRVGLNVNILSGHYTTVSSPTLDAWTKLTFIPTVPLTPTNQSLFWNLLDGGSTTINSAASGEYVAFRNIKVTEIGTLADFRAENFDSDTGKLVDISDNAFVGVATGTTLTGRAYPVYETGTWTPSVTFGGGSTGVTYSTQEGYYIVKS